MNKLGAEVSQISQLIGEHDVSEGSISIPSCLCISLSVVPAVSSIAACWRTRKTTKMIRAFRSTVFIAALFTCTGLISSIDDKCGACDAIAGEIEIGLSNERPRNHLDMRHRLDSKGQREGKVIAYRVSELRAVELLDGLCSKMQDYTLGKSDTRKHEWFKVEDWDRLKIDKQEARAHSKHISSFCGRLLEEVEDELTGRIKGGSIKTGEVSKVLCQDLSKHCNSKRYEEL